METKKIAVACFIGGILCCGVAFICAPAYWWFGLIAGLAGGYISHEFREVRMAIPIALRAARKGGASMWDGAAEEVKAWLSVSHPLLYPAAVIAVPFYICFLFLLGPALLEEVLSSGLVHALVSAGISVVIVVVAFVEFTFVFVGPILLFAFIGARIGEKCYWWPFLNDTETKETLQRLEKQGLKRESLNYWNVTRWGIKGLGITILLYGRFGRTSVSLSGCPHVFLGDLFGI